MSALPGRPQRPLPFRIYAITCRHAVTAGADLPAAVARLLVAAPAGRVAVQLRDKDLPAEERDPLARGLRNLTRRHGALFFINGDLELAIRCGADGVHCGDGDPTLDLVMEHNANAAPERRLWVGASCHDSAGLQRAMQAGADFATLSPVLPSPGKAEPGEEMGWTGFARTLGDCEIPTFALGGLGPADAEAACAAGAWGVAAIRSLMAPAEPGEAVRRLLEPFAAIGSGARGGRIGRALSCTLAGILCLAAPGCGPGEPPADDDDSSQGSDDDDSGALPPPTPVDIPLPDGAFALSCAESEPDDIKIPLDSTIVPDPPWTEATNCGSLPAGATGLLLHITGSIQDLVSGTWNGDNDSYQFTSEATITPRGVLRWDPLQGDFDARVLCRSGDNWRDLFGHQLATAALAESGTAVFSVEAGSTCWIMIVGYSGGVGSYDFWLESTETL